MYPKELTKPTYLKGQAPVGSPARVFAPYQAPAFNSPAVPLGGIVAQLVIQSISTTAQSNVPFTVGHVFKRGDIDPGSILAGVTNGSEIPLQFDVKATHEDGSVRHAMVSGILPSLPSGASVLLGLKRYSAPATKPIPLIFPTSLTQMVSVSSAGATYTAKASEVTGMDWYVGPIMREKIVNVPFRDASGAPHPVLTAQFAIRVYSNGVSRTDVTVENTKAYTSVNDVVLDTVAVSGPGFTYTQAQGSTTHFPWARFHKVFWNGATPAIHVKHDAGYMIRSMMAPNYDQSVAFDQATLASWATMVQDPTKFGPMKFGRWMAYMPTTGGRSDIGLMPDSYVAYLLTMDKRAKDMMLAQADTAGSWSAHIRDDSPTSSTFGLPMNVNNYPYATILGNQSDSFNPNTGKYEKLPALTTIANNSTINSSADSAHQPGIAYLPYLVTGDYYYLEELLFWAGFNAIRMNPAYRKNELALASPEQLRGQGWILRTLAEAAAITPDDHPYKQLFLFQVESNMTDYNTTYTDGNGNVLGCVGNDMSYSVNSTTKNGLSPWQDDFFTSALGHVVELLNLDSSKRFLIWKSKFQISRLTDPAVCIQDAAPYSLAVRPDANSPWFTTIGDCYKFTLPATTQALACGSAARLALDSYKNLQPGDLGNYPDDPTGYPSQLQPGLAAAADSGNPNGLAAWRKFMARPTKPSYSVQPQFALVPRIVTEGSTPVPTVPPTPAPTPTPTPAPTPTPTPAPTPAPAKVTTTTYQEAKLSDVMSYFAKGFTPPAGQTVTAVDYFIDPVKGAVVFKVTTSN